MKILIEDLKTGRLEKDNEFERHSNVLGAKCRYPEADVIYWVYYYPRTGHRPTWRYEWHGDSLGITDPDGNIEVFTQLDQQPNPLLTYVKTRIAEIEASPGDPIPGDQCENWFGKPCYLLGNGCPLENKALQEAFPLEIKPSDEKSILAARAADRPGLAFLALKDGLAPTPKLAGLAWAGCQQLKQGAKLVEQRIKDWVAESGEEFQCGGTTYGMREKEEVSVVDDVLAISLMLHEGFTAADIAKAVNVSRTSLEKGISKRKWGEIKEEILAAIRTEKGKPEFGVKK